MTNDALFTITTPLGFTVKVTYEYWDINVTIKHPVMTGREDDVKMVLIDPDEIRRSKSTANIYLFYRRIQEKRWLCAVAKDESGIGYLITA